MVETAAQAAQAGESLSNVLGIVRDLMPRTHVFAALDTLEFLKRSGRMNRYVAGLGEFLKLKPLLRMHQGIASGDKVRTRERAHERILTWLGDLTPLERVACVHTHVPEVAATLLDRARHLLPGDEDVLSVEVTPVLGAHLGPGTVGFACITAEGTQA
jgi:DegV family protein with EDD domain